MKIKLFSLIFIGSLYAPLSLANIKPVDIAGGDSLQAEKKLCSEVFNLSPPGAKQLMKALVLRWLADAKRDPWKSEDPRAKGREELLKWKLKMFVAKASTVKRESLLEVIDDLNSSSVVDADLDFLMELRYLIYADDPNLAAAAAPTIVRDLLNPDFLKTMGWSLARGDENHTTPGPVWMVERAIGILDGLPAANRMALESEFAGELVSGWHDLSANPLLTNLEMTISELTEMGLRRARALLLNTEPAHLTDSEQQLVRRFSAISLLAQEFEHEVSFYIYYGQWNVLNRDQLREIEDYDPHFYSKTFFDDSNLRSTLLIYRLIKRFGWIEQSSFGKRIQQILEQVKALEKT